jgi:acyl carrier protein
MTTTPKPVTASGVRDALVAALTDLGIDPQDVTDGARLSGDLELDSTETVQVALELTRYSGVKVKLEAKQDLSVADVVHLVLGLVAGS